MKTQVLTLIALLAIVFTTTGSALAKTATDDTNGVVVTEATHFSKIEVRGNVELHISDGAADQVKVYNKYYSECALVQNHQGMLRISSYKAEKLVVWVTVSDLRQLSVYDNAQVISFGQLSTLSLDLNLYDNASAQLDLNSFEANVQVNDRAKADLKGLATECRLTYNRSACVNRATLDVQNLVENNIPHAVAKAEQMAGL